MKSGDVVWRPRHQILTADDIIGNSEMRMGSLGGSAGMLNSRMSDLIMLFLFDF